MASTSSSVRQFASCDKSDFQQIIENSESANTKKATKLSVSLFRQYLEIKGENVVFEELSPGELNRLLGRFYVELRTPKGELYKKTTLLTYRQGIQQHLQNIHPTIDIIRGQEFVESNKFFKGMTMEMKRQGFAAIDHHPPISEVDLLKLYEYLVSSDDAVVLQHKVFIDLMLHFGRRGRGNLRQLKRSDFEIRQDGEGLMYVYKTKDEQTKNHQDDSNMPEGRMYEIKESSRCPMRGFVKYVRRLNPECISLFQRPRKVPNGNVHYENMPVGQNKLGNMMVVISEVAKLSTRYTHHSLRATTVHILDNAMVPTRHIMSITGHRAESSLKSYTGKTTDKKKKILSNTLTSKTMTEDTPLTEITNIPPRVTPVSNNLHSDDSDMMNNGWDSVLARMPMPALPTFNNCSNITINFNFQLTKSHQL